MPSVSIPSAYLPVIAFANKLYPESTPNRLKKFSVYLQAHIEKFPEVKGTPLCMVSVLNIPLLADSPQLLTFYSYFFLKALLASTISNQAS